MNNIKVVKKTALKYDEKICEMVALCLFYPTITRYLRCCFLQWPAPRFLVLSLSDTKISVFGPISLLVTYPLICK